MTLLLLFFYLFNLFIFIYYYVYLLLSIKLVGSDSAKKDREKIGSSPWPNEQAVVFHH